MSTLHKIPPVSLPLLDGKSPNLRLDHPTPAERQHIWRLVAPAWGKALPPP
jgi:hypothetical protein